ncbi:MAG: adenylate/guanylate cyclase domain-containing protein [Thermodesulfobacteriota bacterium]
MIFSLERKFLVFLVLPVIVILLVGAVAGMFYARKHILAQWVESTQLKAEKAALAIESELNDKLALINLIAKTDGSPNAEITQAFLIQQLAAKRGVRFVNLEPYQPKQDAAVPDPQGGHNNAGTPKVLYNLEVCENIELCPPLTDPHALDKSLRIVRILGDPDEEGGLKRLTVRVSFDSFLEKVRGMSLWKKGDACLVTSSGQFLAHTFRGMHGRKRLGETDDPLEKRIVEAIGRKHVGELFGPGHPPDRVVAFYKVPSINWYVLLSSEGRVILEPIIHFQVRFAVACLVGLLVIYALIRLCTRSLARSISAISAAALKVQQGDYSIRLPETQSDEIGQLNRSFNKMAEGLGQSDLIQRTFGRYIDRHVAEELMSKPEALRLGGDKKTVTIMMADIRDFTPIAEKLEPEEVVKMLNRYFAKLIEVIDRYRGIIVDFYGDAILVLFNGFEANVSARALDAVHCAVDMQARMVELERENLQAGLPAVRMGVGIHTGEVIVGNIGAETRAKYGIVGSNVNLTSRIQSTAGGGKIVISEQTYQNVSDKVEVARGFEVCLKGVEEDKKLYEVQSVDGKAFASQ